MSASKLRYSLEHSRLTGKSEISSISELKDNAAHIFSATRNPGQKVMVSKHRKPGVVMRFVTGEAIILRKHSKWS